MSEIEEDLQVDFTVVTRGTVKGIREINVFPKPPDEEAGNIRVQLQQRADRLGGNPPGFLRTPSPIVHPETREVTGTKFGITGAIAVASLIDLGHEAAALLRHHTEGLRRLVDEQYSIDTELLNATPYEPQKNTEDIKLNPEYL